MINKNGPEEELEDDCYFDEDEFLEEYDDSLDEMEKGYIHTHMPEPDFNY